MFPRAVFLWYLTEEAATSSLVHGRFCTRMDMLMSGGRGAPTWTSCV